MKENEAAPMAAVAATKLIANNYTIHFGIIDFDGIECV